MSVRASIPFEVKLVLLGAISVGKSSLVIRFVNSAFQPFIDSTIGASFQTRSISVDGETVKFQIWDTAGAEKYHTLTPMYYRSAAAALIVYSIVDRSSFDAVRSWIEELKSKGAENTVLAIVGNKKDLEDKREVSTQEASAYAESVGALFIETSAKTAENVQELFLQIAKMVPRPDPAAQTDGPDVVIIPSDGKEEQPESKKCC